MNNTPVELKAALNKPLLDSELHCAFLPLIGVGACVSTSAARHTFWGSLPGVPWVWTGASVGLMKSPPWALIFITQLHLFPVLTGNGCLQQGVAWEPGSVWLLDATLKSDAFYANWRSFLLPWHVDIRYKLNVKHHCPWGEISCLSEMLYIIVVLTYF